MPVSVGGKRLGPPPDKLLDWLADTWVEAEQVGRELRRLDRKVYRQNQWLWANPDDPRHAGRTTQAIITAKEFDYYMETLHKLAKRANDLVAQMDEPTRERARTDVSVWAELGSSGIYAHAWGFAPVSREQLATEREEDAA